MLTSESGSESGRASATSRRWRLRLSNSWSAAATVDSPSPHHASLRKPHGVGESLAPGSEAESASLARKWPMIGDVGETSTPGSESASVASRIGVFGGVGVKVGVDVGESKALASRRRHRWRVGVGVVVGVGAG